MEITQQRIGMFADATDDHQWIHVDPEFHDLGTMPYKFRMDAEFAHAYEAAARSL